MINKIKFTVFHKYTIFRKMPREKKKEVHV